MISTIKKSIKQNRFIRGCYYIYRQYFGYPKRAFGYFGENIILTPPLMFFILLKSIN